MAPARESRGPSAWARALGRQSIAGEGERLTFVVGINRGRGGPSVTMGTDWVVVGRRDFRRRGGEELLGTTICPDSDFMD